MDYNYLFIVFLILSAGIRGDGLRFKFFNSSRIIGRGEVKGNL